MDVEHDHHVITMAAACWSWCLSIMNSSITFHLRPAWLGPARLTVLVLVGEVGMQAGLHTNGILLHKDVWRAWSSELSSLFCMWRSIRPPRDLFRGVWIVGAGSELLA